MKKKYTLWNTKPIFPSEFKSLYMKIKSEFGIEIDNFLGIYIELTDQEVVIFKLRYDKLKLYPVDETPGRFKA